MKLELDDLHIESFETTDEANPARGTVQGHMHMHGGFSCPPRFSCPECASPIAVQ